MSFSTITPCAIREIIISKGQHFELPLPTHSQFTVGTPDVISYKQLPQKQQLLLKGKKTGHCEIVIWGPQKKSTYAIYVLSKPLHLRFIQLQQTFKSMGLQASTYGTTLLVQGNIHQLADLQLMQKLSRQYEHYIYFRGSISRSLRNHIIGEIYQLFFHENVREISCRPQNLWILCHYTPSAQLSAQFLKSLPELYPVKLLPLSPQTSTQNYYAKLKLVQIEHLDGQEITFGMDHISGMLQDLYSGNLKSLFIQKKMFLEKQNLKLTVLAEPETTLLLNAPATITLGAEIPYQLNKNNDDSNPPHLQWKFAGLQIYLKLTPQGQNFILEYKTKFSRPFGENISGGQSSSRTILKLQRPTLLFEIGHQSSGEEITAIPWLNEIPLLRALFSSASKQTTYKKIHGIIEVIPSENKSTLPGNI